MFNLLPWKSRHPWGSDDASALTGWRWGLTMDDREDEVVVRAEAPGFEPDEFNVQMRGDHLLIEAEHKEEKQDDRSASYRYGRVHRLVPLPHGVQSDKITARYRNGVLEIHAPKSEEAKGKRIAVQSK